MVRYIRCLHCGKKGVHTIAAGVDFGEAGVGQIQECKYCGATVDRVRGHAPSWSW